MKNRKWMKKATAVILSAAMVASLTGCGGSGAKSDQKDIKELVYDAQVMPGMDQIKGDFNNFAVNGDTVYLYTSEWIEESAPDGEANEPQIEARTAEAEVTAETEDAATQEQTAETEDATAGEETAETEDATAGEETAETEDAAATEQTTDTEEATDETAETTQESETEDDTLIDEEFGVDEYQYTVNQYFYSMKTDGSDFKEIFSRLDCGDSNEWMNDFRVSDSGDIYMLYSCYDMQTEKNTYIIRICDASGNETGEISLDDLLSGDETYFQSMQLDKDGNIYLLGDQMIYVLDGKGAKLFDVKLDGWSSGMTVTNEGNIIVSVNAEDGVQVKAVDVAKKALGEAYKLDANLYNGNSLIGGAGDYTFYFNDGSSIWGYDAKSSTAKELLNWVSSNINASNMNNVLALPDGRFIATYYDYSTEDAENGIYIMTKVDPSQIKDKTVITYAGTWVDDMIKSQAVRFNKSQDQYQIVVKDYSSSDDPIKDMNADLIAGNIPDIIDLSGLNTDQYIAKGMLADLYTFMEKDPDINKEDFIDNILKVLETDGKLYHISPSFGVSALVCKTKDLGGKTSLTVKDVQQLEEKYGNGAKAFHMRSNTGVLSMFFTGNYDTYIDWTTGKCSFDSQEFIDLLEYANTYPNDDDIDWENGYESLPTGIRNNKILFADLYSMSMEEVELYSEMFQEDISFIGYPNDQGTGLAATIGTDIGIYAKSANADGAWEFVKTFLTEEYISGGKNGYMYYSGFPLRKDALENEIKKNSTTVAYTDKFGNEIQPLDSSWGYDDIEVKIKPLTDAQVQMLRDVIASVDHMYGYNDEISTIITEESGAYFSGQKSAKEVADIIQNRVSTYVNENR